MRFDRAWIRVAALSGCISLGGCEFALLDADEKINAAVPVQQAVEVTMAELLQSAPADQRRKIEGEYAARLKLRALSCAKGYSPSRLASLDEVRKELRDRSCFAKTDAGIAKWIGLRRVAVLLLAPPLEPIPSSPPRFIVGDAFIQSVHFAERAGIALFGTQQSLQVVDIGSGRTYYQEPKSSQQLGALSANGRLFVTSSENNVRIRSAESGEVLVEVPKARAHGFQWIDEQTALYNSGETNKAVLIDFASGEEIPVPEIQGTFTRVVTAADGSNQFLVGTYRTVVKASIERSDQAAKVQLIDEKPLAGASWALNTSGATADGARWFNGSKDLSILSFETLEQETISFEPMHVQTAIATPDPDKLILTGFIKGANAPRKYLYSLGGRTLAEIDRGKLVSERLLYIPTLKRQAAIADSKIAVLDELPVGEAIPLDRFIAAAAEESNLRKMEEFQRAQSFQGGQAFAAPAPGAYADSRGIAGMAGGRLTGPLADIAKDTQIESVGVYQGSRSAGRSANATEAGAVEVRIRRSPKPVLLVLSSYEAVRWNLRIEPGARLAGVLVSGYKISQSHVTGNGSALVMPAGSSYAYKPGSNGYSALNLSVQRLTGKQIENFQGSYEGSTFSVGGR